MCDGWEYDKYKNWLLHDCPGNGPPNHTLINKAKYRGVKGKARDYFDNKINMSDLCIPYHAQYGETTEFREFWKQRQEKVYGVQTVKNFYLEAPMKVKPIYSEPTVTQMDDEFPFVG
jgi:hypothetical protein